MTVDVPMVNIIDFYPKQIKLKKYSLSTKGVSFLCHQMNVLFLIHLENENPQTGSHLQVLEGESVL